ncbi:MAG: hypothetical protein PWR03_535 [Tenuifilum sp.]|jgi:hypothetical protein|uniref:DUF4145 domain-containing protein n=1 Tax=Tenuifilum sp. TaxID=2760880 RepID=UPI0024AB2651|nr:DUF4145 domain-containing protein [Tenuifilum sp.]MDI3526352.1 hypothetical protein [Tenuifilum sp.]
MDDISTKREKITQFCNTCNAITEAEIIFGYIYNDNEKIYIEELLQYEGVMVYLAKCLNCGEPILLSEYFVEIEGQYFPQERIQLYPERESKFVAKAPMTIIKPYREAIKCFKANAYEACVIMCRKGIEAICFDKGENKGNLISKLKKLKEKGVLSETFFEWSNELREIGNLGAHSHYSEISKQDAKDTLEFFEALILYLYHLVDKYIEFKERKDKKTGHNKV